MVAKLSAEQAEGVYQVRIELEGLACQLFAERASDAQRAALSKAFAKLKSALRQPDPLARLNAKNYFYDCLIDGSRNEALGMSLRMLNARVMLLRATSLRAPGRSSQSLAELSDLMDALMARDGKRARKAAATMCATPHRPRLHCLKKKIQGSVRHEADTLDDGLPDERIGCAAGGRAGLSRTASLRWSCRSRPAGRATPSRGSSAPR